MFILSNLLVAVAHILDIALTILYWLILIRALISWVNPDPYNPIAQFLYKTTEPILYKKRFWRPMGSRFSVKSKGVQNSDKKFAFIATPQGFSLKIRYILVLMLINVWILGS